MKKVLESELNGVRKVDRLRKRWIDKVKNTWIEGCDCRASRDSV